MRVRTAILSLLVGAALAPHGHGAAAKQQPVAGTHTVMIVARDGLAFVGQTGGLVIHDVKDPLRPTSLSWLPLPATVLDVQLVGHHALLAAGTRGLVVVDVSDPERPLELARLNTDGKAKRIVSAGRYAFLADGINGLLVLDMKSIDDPRVVARISTSGDLRAVALSGERLAIAEGHGGIRVFNVRRMNNPVELRRLRADFSARDVCWIGDRLFVAAGSKGTAVYRPERSSEPDQMLPPVRSAQHVSCSEETLAISNLGSAIQLFDATTLQELSRLRVHRSAPIGRSSFDAGRLWIAVDIAGLGLLDLTDRKSPERILPRRREFKVNY